MSSLRSESAGPQRRQRRTGGTTVQLRDVARQAGVSTASVSRAVNTPDLVSPELRDRITRAAQELKWVPNGVAKALASLRTRTVGAIIPTLSHQNFANLIEELQHDLGKANYTLILGCVEKSDQLRLNQARKLIEQGVECLVLVGEAQPAGMFELLASQDIPYVITYTAGRESGHPCIGFDNFLAATQLADHLLGLGHRNFGMVAHETEANDRIQQRIEGFNSVLAQAGIAIRPQHFVRANSRFIASGREGMRRVLQAAGPHPTAVVCTNDYIATGALLEAKELGFAVPDDLSIVGFDDTDMSAHLDPPLTTIRVPSRLMGRELAKYIVALLDTKEAECPPPLEAEMIIRKSTAPPRQGLRSA